MADMFNVRFLFEGAPQVCRYEFKERAFRFAKGLEEIENVDRVIVTDEFDRNDDGYPKTIYNSEDDDGPTPP